MGDQTVNIIRVWTHSAGQCFLGWLYKDHLKEVCKNTDLSAKSLETDYPRQFFRTFVIRATATGNPDMSRLDIQANFVARKMTFWKGEKLVKVYWSSLKNIKLEKDLRHISEAELLESGDQQEYFGVIKEDRRVKNDSQIYCFGVFSFTSSPNLRPKTIFTLSQTQSNGDYVQNTQLLKWLDVHFACWQFI